VKTETPELKPFIRVTGVLVKNLLEGNVMEQVEQVFLLALKIYLGAISLAIGILSIYGLCRPEVFSRNAENIIWVGKAIGCNSLGILIVLAVSYFLVYKKNRSNRRNNQNSNII
jgi:hypothetical protein